MINRNKCNLCGNCILTCPFDALKNDGGEICVNASCKACKICIKNCPQSAIFLDETTVERKLDKDEYKGILVFIEHMNGAIHPISYELIGEAKRLAAVKNYPVYCIIMGSGLDSMTKELTYYATDKVLAYDYEELAMFRADLYAKVFSSCIDSLKPSVVLVGATSIGRSLAPRVAAMRRTGLTADCTKLEMRESGDLVQIRPAFGGNIMAKIVTLNTRPQFATVRYKVMQAQPRLVEASGEVVDCKITESGIFDSGIEILSMARREKTVSISEAEKIIAVGRGLKDKKDMEQVFKLAKAIGAEVAVTRPLVEAGYMPYTHQIGLSGRTVRPRLIITLGVSGAVQFTACMKTADFIIAVNKDKAAPIFDIAHVGVVGDLYEIMPELERYLSGEAAE